MWQQVGENLVRYQAGTIYLRARVAGKIVRQSLGTSDLRIAKLKRDATLARLRDAAAEASKAPEIRTLGDGLDELARRSLGPHLKPATRDDYQKQIATLRRTLPVTTLARSWSADSASDWWQRINRHFSPRPANKILRFARLLSRLLIDLGHRTSDPLASIRPMKVVRHVRHLPTREQIDAIVANARSMYNQHSDESGRFIAFLAFSGCRPGEVPHVEWHHYRGRTLDIQGGQEGTKNRQGRTIPVCPPLRRLLAEMRRDIKARGITPAGPIFGIRKPRFALDNACRRLGFPPMTLYDLRHWFATWALESGVDVPTVSRWIGHRDGGALLIRTYVHVRDAHSLRQARRLR